MIAAGLGFRRGVSAEEIEAALALALARLPRVSGESGTAMTQGRAAAPNCLATLAEKADEPGLREAARRLSLPIVACSRVAMAEVADRIVTVSARAQASVGLPSVAEAAALVAAGGSSRLHVPRVATPHATCAIAEGDGPGEAR
jgi:cobalt-precorrin 5A hydrolase